MSLISVTMASPSGRKSMPQGVASPEAMVAATLGTPSTAKVSLPSSTVPVGAAVEVTFEEVAPGQLIHEWRVV